MDLSRESATDSWTVSANGDLTTSTGTHYGTLDDPATCTAHGSTTVYGNGSNIPDMTMTLSLRFTGDFASGTAHADFESNSIGFPCSVDYTLSGTRQ